MWIFAALVLFAQEPAGSLRGIEKLIAAGQHREALQGLGVLPDSFDKRLLASKALDGMGDAQRAVTEAEAALAIDPRAEAAHLQLGQIFLGNNTPQAALDVFTEALAMHPNSLLLHAGRGLALKDLIRYADAEKELLRCLALRAGFPVCFDGLATVYLHTKRFDEMERAAVEQRKVNPRDFRGPYFEAVARNAREEKDVETLLGESIRLNEGFAAAHALLGRVLLQRGEVARAIASLETAVRLRPAYPPALLNLAQAYKRAGRDGDAARTYDLLREANEKERQGKPALIYHRGPAQH
ncbi:MAG: tetratricopeptide repeat protein [Acidobacteria bacterium]|nr:tetratricopeptide repeat protein [Acidobacteriota bacterium]